MIQDISGEGFILDGEKNLGKVKYDLQKYIPPGFGHKKISGTIHSVNINFHQLSMNRKMFVLQLNENDCIEFMISNVSLPNSASITCSGPIFQKED